MGLFADPDRLIKSSASAIRSLLWDDAYICPILTTLLHPPFSLEYARHISQATSVFDHERVIRLIHTASGQVGASRYNVHVVRENHLDGSHQNNRADENVDHSISGHHPWCVLSVTPTRRRLLCAAELALAMLQGCPVKGLPETAQSHCLQLSHISSSVQSDDQSRSQCFPQYVKGLQSNILRNMRAETVFTIFRRAGPIVSIRFDVNIGSDALVCSVQYFTAKDAHLAKTLAVESILEKVRAAKQSISLQTYDPCTLIYTVRHLHAV